MNPSRGITLSRAMMAAVCALVLTGQAWAGGFSIYEQGAAATAQGGAFVARAWDASAGFYNPAGLAMYGQPGQWRIYGGITPVQSMAKFQGMNPSPGSGVRDAAKDKFFLPFNLHAAYQINENMAAGLSITTPFGLGTEWKNKDNTYSGRFRSILSNIQAVYISPTFSYKVMSNLSLGVGIDYVVSNVELKRNNSQPFFNGTSTVVYDVAQVELTGSDKGSVGFHFGALYKATDQISCGVDYKHSIKNKYEGSAKFHQILNASSSDPFGAVVDASVASNLANPLFGGMKQDGNTSVEFPKSLAVGVAYKPMEKLSLEVDYIFAGWSSFKEVVIEFPENQTGLTSVLEENYKDTWQIRFGAEYWATDQLALRCGYIFDKTPAPTETVNPLLPDADRNDIGLGIGYKLNDRLQVDASYLAVFFKERSTEGKNVDGYDGIYNSHVNLWALSFSYTIGGK